MQYPLYDFNALHDEGYRKELKSVLSNIIDSNAFIEGEYNFKFEEEFARMQKAKHCLLVGNGTDALEISLKACGVKHGDKVGIPALTFYATAESVINVGAIPVMIDIESHAPILSVDSLKRVHEKQNLKAVIPVHLYGIPAPMKNVNSYCEEKKIEIVEDGAQASGTNIEFGPVGSNPNSLTIFSFYPTKNLSAMGDAGAILFSDDSKVDLIKAIRNHGRGMEGIVGRNSRCDHFQAAVLYLKLKKLEQHNKRRKEIAKLYLDRFDEIGVETIPSTFLETSSWHLFPLKMENRERAEELAKKLVESGVGCTTTYYSKSMPQEKALENFQGEWEEANKFSGRMVCIPIHPFLSEKDVDFISQSVSKCL